MIDVSKYGMYVTIYFRRNLNREVVWCYRVEDLEDQLFIGGGYSSRDLAELECWAAIGRWLHGCEGSSLRIVPGF